MFGFRRIQSCMHAPLRMSSRWAPASYTITVSFQHEYFSEFVKEYVSAVNMNIIMKGCVSPIKMNFNELFNIMKGVYYQLL